MIDLVLPWPPSANTYWRHQRGRHMLSPVAREYRERVKPICWALGIRPLRGHVTVDVIACPPDRRKRDLDNLAKPLFDVLTAGGVWIDDVQVVQFSFARGEVIKQGVLVLRIQTVSEAGDRVDMADVYARIARGSLVVMPMREVAYA